MKRTLKQLDETKVEVTIEAEKEAWKQAQEKAIDQLCDKVTVKGFREGKAPKELAKKQVNPADALDRAVRNMLQPMYEEILKEEKIEPFTQPNVNVSKVSNEELEVVFTIITAPKVQLGEYKGIHIDMKVEEVKEEAVDAEVEKMRAQNAQLVLVEREAKSGDTVSIDFEGFVDGKAFEGGKAENYALELGSNQFVPGFEDQLIGTKAGDEKDVVVTFPEQYVENLKGKEATFKVKVHEVKEKQIPELNEDFVADLNLPEVKTVEDLKANCRKNLEAQAEQKAKNDHYQALVDKIVSNAKITVCKEIIDSEVAQMKENMVQKMSQQGLTMEQYLQITGQKEEELNEMLAKDAHKNVCSYLTLQSIAAKEKLTVTEEEIEFEMSKIAEQYKMDLAKVKEILGKDLGRFQADLLNRKIYEFLIENNK